MRVRPAGIVTIGALAVLGLALPGCATRNGSVAAFCKELPNTPAVSTVYSALNTSDTDAAIVRIKAMAASMRTLERVAPRTVRSDVATTADFAQHVADELHRLPAATRAAPLTGLVPPAVDSGPATSVVGPPTSLAGVPTSSNVVPGSTVAPGGTVAPGSTVPFDPTQTTVYEGGPYGGNGFDQFLSDPRAMAVSRVLRQYPRAAAATSRFVSYSESHCAKGVVPKGYDTSQYPGDPGLGNYIN